MQKLKLTGLSILSGLLMGLSWPATGNLAPLFFFALLPLLYVEYTVSQNPDRLKSRHFYFFALLTFITFNGYTTWWIYFASGPGMLMAVVLNSIFMGIIWLWFHNIKKNFGDKKGYMSLVFLWIAFEWLHYHWEFSHPWATFGNTFANYPQLIQWYEFTGVHGGTLWLLIVNILCFQLYRKVVILGESMKIQAKSIGIILIMIVIPMLISVLMYTNYHEKAEPTEVVVIQPNIDPYRDKFGGMTVAEQIRRIISLAEEKTTASTSYVVAPETAIPRGSLESELEMNYSILEIRQYLERHPQVKFVIGASTYIDYPQSEQKPTPTARPDKQTGGWYDAFNSALLIEKDKTIQIYHKSKLVLGVERLPFAKILAPLENFAINLGGTFGSLGTEKEAKFLDAGTHQIAPVICYESIYGDYVGDYISKGSDLIFVITNDGWWEDTPGYKQHLSYSRLRAIESRRSIARSANTGISCFINQRGDVIDPTDWWVPAVISGTINSNSELTFYSKYGDYLGRVFAAISAILLLWHWTLKLKRRFGVSVNV
ncbi:MAG: apolipoprotein N-acyltransferase [Flavobacteriales bacterium]|nr:apolipoprotein N-acyltransferase [Flavobacteriales bacterium]